MPNSDKNTIHKKLEIIIKMIADTMNVQVNEVQDGFVLDIPVIYNNNDGTKETRRQFVYVTYNRVSDEGDDLYQIFSICGPENPKLYRVALAVNMEIAMGAVAISNVNIIDQNIDRKIKTLPPGTEPKPKLDEKRYFVVVDTCLASEASFDKIRVSILSVAEAGDRIEKMLIEQDIC